MLAASNRKVALKNVDQLLILHILTTVLELTGRLPRFLGLGDIVLATFATYLFSGTVTSNVMKKMQLYSFRERYFTSLTDDIPRS